MSKHLKAMSRALYVAKRFINQYIWRPLQLLAEVVHPVPALSAFLLFFLFAHVGQLQEIYFSSLEPPFDSSKALHLLWALIALVLLSGALFHINYALSTLTINIIYSRSSSYHTDSWLKVVRTVLGLVVAGAPWLGLLVGMQRAAHRALEDADRVRVALQPLRVNPETVLPQLAAIDVLPMRIWLVMLAVLVLGAATLGVLHVCRRKARFWSAGILVVCTALFVILLVPSLLTGASGKLDASSPIDSVVYYRSIGALAMVFVVALGLLASVAVMAYLADQIGFPLIPVTIVLAVTATIMHWPPYWIASIAGVAFVLIAVLGVLSRRWPLAILSLTFALLSLSVVRQLEGNAISIDASAGQSKSAHSALRERFVAWLADRSGQRESYVRDRGKDYPVLVIAAQGGGIYAATAVAAFLSRLQDRCPGFAGHVFAISGVSGGAVGSAIFQSLMQGSNPQATGCRGDADAIIPALSQQTANVVLDDHLAPLLGLLPADLVGLQSDRSHALEESFIRSVAQHGGSGALKSSFEAHWPKSVAPALLLNATWVETGYRVAFAPFTLGGMRDGTLYAFGDANLAIGSAVESLSLAGAAVVSARFPGVVPAFSFKRITRKGNEEIIQRWNFVDGGYADESGSATALEVYRELEKTISARGERNIDLRLVLLTNATPAPDFSRIQGTPARDFLAPALTLLSVRDLLAKQAIMRTVTEIDPNNAKDLQWRISPSQRGEREKWKVAIVELDQESFTLALGWNLSRATQAIVSLLVGRPELCPDAPDPSGPTAAPDTTSDSVSQKAGEMKISTQIIRANSCVTRALEKLVSTAP